MSEPDLPNSRATWSVNRKRKHALVAQRMSIRLRTGRVQVRILAGADGVWLTGKQLPLKQRQAGSNPATPSRRYGRMAMHPPFKRRKVGSIPTASRSCQCSSMAEQPAYTRSSAGSARGCRFESYHWYHTALAQWTEPWTSNPCGPRFESWMRLCRCGSTGRAAVL